MKNIIKLAMSAMLALGCANIANSQACLGFKNTISDTVTSSALGADNKVYGKASTAVGQLNTVSVSTSTNPAYAIGYKNTATAKLSFAIGDQNTVSQIYSFAMGQNNIVSDGYSFAIGTDNKVNANTSIALGYYLRNTKKYGVTIGMGKNRNIPLVNNTNGIVMGMYSDVPTLFISRSADAGKTGKVGIGNVTNPQAKLHIKADNYSYDGEDADIMLEPTRSGKKAAIYFMDTVHYISVAANNGIMKFGADKYIFNGNAAIGAKGTPYAKLHVFGQKGEDADIILQPTDNAKNAEILFRSTSNKISVGSDNAMNFSSNSFIFNPTGKMEINGTLQVDKSIILKELAGDTAKRLVCASGEGLLSTVDMNSLADNMGSHVAEKNIRLNGFKLVNIKDDGGIFLDRGNNVGIGTLEPKQMLHVVGGNILITRTSSKNTDAPGSANGSILFGDVASAQNPFGAWGIEYLNDDEFGYGLNFWKTGDLGGGSINHVLFLCDEGDYKGNVGIGTPRPLHKLSVNGTVLARELIVSKLDEDWPDYVFDPGYSLTSLEELGSYVRSERHLPGVPSAKEIEESGVKVGEMNALLLKKVEELTLYVIELQRQINEMKGKTK